VEEGRSRKKEKKKERKNDKEHRHPCAIPMYSIYMVIEGKETRKEKALDDLNDFLSCEWGYYKLSAKTV
jgi:hypothetical protein